MTKRTPVSRIAQALSGFALLAISLTVGITGMKLNVTNGLQVSIEAAIIFGAADAARLILPVVCAICGWTRQMKAIAVICVVASLFCSVTAFTAGSDQNLASKQAGADHYAAAQADVTKAESRVSSLDAQVLQEGKNRGCGPACKALKQEAAQARAELGAAKVKAETAKPVAISGHETLETRIKALLLLLIVEALVWLSLPAMICFKLAFAKPKERGARKGSRAQKRAPARTKIKPIAANVVAFPPKLTKSGKVDGRTRQARAVKRVTASVMA